ncbi:MAG: CHAT domain-containing protein [bacterium]|nr:CHAT domain-containing protein [bacterium]
MLAAEDYEVAASRCEEIFEESRDPRAGVAAARACRALGRGDEVLSWLERLRESSEAAVMLGMAAKVHQERGDVARAREMLDHEIALERLAGDHRQAARALYRLFYFSWETSDYRQALLAAHQSFEEAAAAEDREMQRYAAEGLYSVLYAVGDLEGARRALEAAERLLTPEDPRDRARLLANQGAIRLDEGHPALARDALERALAEAAGSGDRRFLRAVHLNLVKASLTLGEIEPAERHLREAWRNADPDDPGAPSLRYYQARVEHARQRYDEAAATLEAALGHDPVPDWAWDLEHQRGLAEEARGELAAAEDAYQRAAAIVEQMRCSLGFDELKPWLLDRKREPFEALVRLRAQAGRAVETLDTVERAKARTLVEALGHATSTAPAPDANRWQAEAAVDRLEALEALLPPLRESPVVALRPLETVLAAVGDRHVLVYFAGGERMWLLAVHGRRIDVRPLSESPAAIRKLVQRFLARPEEAEPASLLGELLLPEGSLPPPGSTLYLVPDGELGRLPFAAIRRRGRYLVEDYALTYVPSLNALVAGESRPSEGWEEAVVLGDPRGDLPGAAREAREVAVRLRVSASTSGGADLEHLRRAARARVLHLATHTGLGPGGPWLLLADGEVSAGTLVAEGLAPRLVVLAGCASAARRGRGMWGSLGAAFFAAGSRMVLASLWSIEDQPTRAFVRRFYREGGEADAAGALARTQRAFIADRRSPTTWASFILMGSDSNP